MNEMDPADRELLPARARIETLLELMSAEELRELYLMFADRARQAAVVLAAEPGRPGEEQLELCVHDIKGTAANLGLDHVAALAGAVLEIVRRDGAARAAASRGPLLAALERLPAVLAGEDLARLLGVQRA